MDRIEFISKGDRILDLFGMQVEEAHEGYACVSAPVREEFLNAHGIAHGALVFALLDVAFSITVNSVMNAAGVQWSFNIVRAATPGETLTAECSLVHGGSRVMVVEYTVVGRDGRLVAQGQATAMPIDPGRLREPEAEQGQDPPG